MRELRWARAAQQDIARLHAFLEIKDAEIALRALKKVRETANRLREWPDLGRQLTDSQSQRVLFVPFGMRGYVLRYGIDPAGNIVILRVWHVRENLFH